MNKMTKEELLSYLLSEEGKTFKGWDFSYLDNRMESGSLPWKYREIIEKYLKPTDNIIDLGTGGGEFLLTLKHPYHLTSVTEAYEPNIKLCEETLAPLGITVYPETDDFLANIFAEQFDIVIDRHESFEESEIKRILKPNGVFITQQVGAYNNKDLATFFDSNHVDQFPKMTLDKTVERLVKAGFEILFSEEYFPKLRFFDLGAVAYFAKIISWEFIDFSVTKTIDKFIELQELLLSKGVIESTEHRFMIVAKKGKA